MATSNGGGGGVVTSNGASPPAAAAGPKSPTCSPSLSGSLAGTRAISPTPTLPVPSNAERRDDDSLLLIGGNGGAAAGASPSSSLMGGEKQQQQPAHNAGDDEVEAAFQAQAGCGMLPSAIADNLVISVVSGAVLGGCVGGGGGSVSGGSRANGEDGNRSKTNAAAASGGAPNSPSAANSVVSQRSGVSGAASLSGSLSGTRVLGRGAPPTSVNAHARARARAHVQNGGTSTGAAGGIHDAGQAAEEEEGILDWVGNSIQSYFYDAIFPPAEEGGGAAAVANNGNANANGTSAPPAKAKAQDVSPNGSMEPKRENKYLKLARGGAKSPISFAASSRPTNANASVDHRGHHRAQTAPPPAATASWDSGTGREVQITASVDSTDDSRGTNSRSLLRNKKSRDRVTAASLKMSRSRSGGSEMASPTSPQQTPSPSKSASFDVAAAATGSSSRDEQPLRLSSLRPPLGPRLGAKAGRKDAAGGGGATSWTGMHNRLIDELFEASRRQYLTTHGGHAGHHHNHRHHDQDKEQKDHSGWKLGNLLPGGHHGSGNDAGGDGAKSGSAAKSEKTKEGMKTSADANRAGGFRLPWSSGSEPTKKRRKKRPKLFRRKKKKEKGAVPASGVGGIGASVTSALTAAAAVATGSDGTSAKEKSLSTKLKQSKPQPGPSPSTGSNTSSLTLTQKIARFSPSKKKPVGDVNRSVTFAKDTASSRRSITRATGEYTGRPNPDPGTYLHPKCRLQKDKGRGQVPGKTICVKSREKALAKLRQKVDVIIEVEQTSEASTKAKLKLKQAVCTAKDDGVIETRSVISVKMGFLSMKYGILLRWETDTGLVNLIVLRKMCSSGFLAGDDGNAAVATDPVSTPKKALNRAPTKAASAPAASSEGQPKSPRRTIKDSSPSKHGFILGRLVDGANAILHGKGWDSDASAIGTEVAHLAPPYLVERPKSFAEATLSITVLRAEDLCAGDKRGSDWMVNPYVRVSIGTQTHRTRALKMTTSPIWTKHGDNTCHLAVSNNPRDDDQHLKVEIYDWGALRRDRILGVVFVPVASVEPQKSNKTKGRTKPVSTEATIPVRMIRNKEGPYGFVTLSLVHQNDHLCWLKEELKARGRD